MKSGKTPFPTKAEILAYIADNPAAARKRDIARAFQVKGDDKVALRDLLREMKREGLLEVAEKRGRESPRHLPSVTVIEVVALDRDGELIARPAGWDADSPGPRILLQPSYGRRGGAYTIGDRFLARLSRQTDRSYLRYNRRRLGGSLPSQCG